MDASADSSCIHQLMFTASLIPRLLVGQLTPINTHVCDVPQHDVQYTVRLLTLTQLMLNHIAYIG